MVVSRTRCYCHPALSSPLIPPPLTHPYPTPHPSTTPPPPSTPPVYIRDDVTGEEVEYRKPVPGPGAYNAPDAFSRARSRQGRGRSDDGFLVSSQRLPANAGLDGTRLLGSDVHPGPGEYEAGLRERGKVRGVGGWCVDCGGEGRWGLNMRVRAAARVTATSRQLVAPPTTMRAPPRDI